MMLLDFVSYLFRCQSLHTVHSPFVYTFCTQVLPAQKLAIAKDIEAIRKKLLNDKTVLEWEELGAGFNGNQKGKIQKTVQAITKSSARKASEGALLYRICQFYKPKRALEFGTNLGISSLYQFSAIPDSQYITMEGVPAFAAIARQNFAQLSLQPQVLVGEFSYLLKEKISLQDYRPDYVFLDGNHKYEATMEYFYQLLPHLAEDSILILDDIYWSKGMKKAWQEIIRHADVSVSIDIFTFGICFMKRKQAKEHFTLFQLSAFSVIS